MGIFNFFKKKKEIETPKIEEIKIAEIENWISNQYEETSAKIKSTLKELKEKLEEEKNSLKEKIEILKTAEIKNQKIPERAKQAMEGNRETYTQKLETFIEKIELPLDPEKISEFHNQFDKELNNFEKTVARNHAIVEQFFGEKAGAIIKHMKELDGLIKKSNNLVKLSDLEKIKFLKKLSNELNKSEEKKESLKKEISYSEELLEKDLKKIEELEKQLEESKNKKDYKEIQELINNKEFAEKELATQELNLKHSFSEIEPALKKYENLSQNKIAKNYLANPINSLIKDKELEIAKILSATSSAIEQGEIYLKEKKKEKTTNELAKMTKNYFESFLEKRTKLKEQVATLNSKIINSDLMNEINQLKEEISHRKIKLKEKKLDFHEKKKSYEKINPQSLKTELQDEINETFKDKEIKIN